MTRNHNIQKIIEQNKMKKTNTFEKLIPYILFLITSISILATISILYILASESIEFFKRIPFSEFITGTEWRPYSGDAKFGIWALISGTFRIVLIAAIVAMPIGLGAAIYLSEYANETFRKIVKPILEILAGIPTVVYGYFAINFVTPLLRSVTTEIDLFNAISPGLVVGIMIIPMIASLSEDAMSSVPRAMREGSYGMGATKIETTIKVVIPAAISGIMASFVLGISRAIGETMIVSIAAGSNPNFSLDVTGTLQTMTAFIVQITSGDTAFGTDIYYSLFAVGLTLFFFTFLMNMISIWISKRFREEY